jgi:hypothetical protein
MSTPVPVAISKKKSLTVIPPRVHKGGALNGTTFHDVESCRA